MRHRIAGSALPAVLIGPAPHAHRTLGTIVRGITKWLVRRRFARNATVRLNHVIDTTGLAVRSAVPVVGTGHTITAAAEGSDLAIGIVAALDTDLAVETVGPDALRVVLGAVGAAHTGLAATIIRVAVGQLVDAATVQQIALAASAVHIGSAL